MPFFEEYFLNSKFKYEFFEYDFLNNLNFEYDFFEFSAATLKSVPTVFRNKPNTLLVRGGEMGRR